jgi:single-stranded DNA-binding protein
MNRVFLLGTVSQYGPKITWTDTGKPHTTFTLVCEEARKDGATFKTFIPILIVSPQAELLAESLEPGEPVLLEGRLAYQKGKGPQPETGKLSVICFTVERLSHRLPAAGPV